MQFAAAATVATLTRIKYLSVVHYDVQGQDKSLLMCDGMYFFYAKAV